jgi:hypothetical protein
MATIPTDLLKRVIYSKYLFQRAQNLEAEGHELALAGAVLAAHDAVEMLMRVVTDKLNVQWTHDFMKFWRIVEAKTQKMPPRLASIGQLNDDRIGFKHKGIPPNPTTVSDRLRNALAFCEELATEYLDLDYQTVSLADLIPKITAREAVKEAEVAIAAGILGTAFEKLGIAFDDLLREIRQKHGAALVGSIEIVGRAFVRDAASESLKSKLQKIAETVDALILGIDPAKLRRFDELTPIRQHMASGAVTIVWRRDPENLTIHDFEFCHSFVIDFGLRHLTI